MSETRPGDLVNDLWAECERLRDVMERAARALDAATGAAVPLAAPRGRWRHKKRGTVYEVVVSDASLQCSAAPEFEASFGAMHWTVYRGVGAGATGAVYVRPTDEFMDGRFERVSDE